MKALHARLTVLTAASFATVALASPAEAAGCNGVVNPAVWGCAPWDNNNGPNFPYYKKQTPPSPVAKGATPNPGSRISPNAPRNGGSLIGNDGGSLIGNDGAGVKPPK